MYRRLLHIALVLCCACMFVPEQTHEHRELWLGVISNSSSFGRGTNTAIPVPYEMRQVCL